MHSGRKKIYDIELCVRVGTCKVSSFSSLSSVSSAHVEPGDILNNFCFDVYAQM